MGKFYSSDLRERVVAAIDAGMTRHQAAARFGVSPSSAIRWHKGWCETGAFAPQPQGGDQRSGRIEALKEVILSLIKARKDITLEEICVHLEERHGERFVVSTVHRFFQRHKITFKKNGSCRGARAA
jgi:transposase